MAALSKGKIESFWFGSGTPTYLIEMLNKFQVIFDAPTERMTDITPLFYQSGYLTIKNYSTFSGLYQLDIPNKEVRIGLMKSLLVNYVQRPAQLNTLVGEMAECIHFDDMDGALRLMQTVLSTVPYCENTRYQPCLTAKTPVTKDTISRCFTSSLRCWETMRTWKYGLRKAGWT